MTYLKKETVKLSTVKSCILNHYNSTNYIINHQPHKDVIRQKTAFFYTYKGQKRVPQTPFQHKEPFLNGRHYDVNFPLKAKFGSHQDAKEAP